MTLNGIDTDQLTTFGEHLVANPIAAEIRAQVRTRWSQGYYAQSTTESFHLAGQDIPRATAVTVDLPEVLGGTDRGPAPGELVLAALGACVAGAFVENAAVASIQIDRLEVSATGHLDLRGTAGVEGVRPGMSRIDLEVEVASTADDATVAELLAAAVRRSPVADSLAAGVALATSFRQTHPTGS